MRISGSGQRRQKVDDFSNNKRSNGSKTHPLKSAILISRASRSVVRLLRESDWRRLGDVAATSPIRVTVKYIRVKISRRMSTPPSLFSSIAITELVNPKKKHFQSKCDSHGRRIMFLPSAEFLTAFLDWRQSRLEVLPLKCAFDRWYEALLKENIWHQWMLRGLVKNMDIPRRLSQAYQMRPEKNAENALNLL